ncbi:MAG: hypothetical protein ACFFG0_19445 [Candidatus Thorarchaeota archaeon]
MQKENPKLIRKNKQKKNNTNKLISFYENEIKNSEFNIKEGYSYSLLQWRYKKKLDMLLEKLHNKI